MINFKNKFNIRLAYGFFYGCVWLNYPKNMVYFSFDEY